MIKEILISLEEGSKLFYDTSTRHFWLLSAGTYGPMLPITDLPATIKALMELRDFAAQEIRNENG